MIKPRYIAFLICFVSFSGFGQIDTSVTIISKIDFLPQYELHDQNEILLMGFSVNIGGGLNLPSPTLEFVENDSVELNLWNLSQGPPHTIHLHGLDVDQQNDGVPMLSWEVEHDDTGSYYFQAPHPGTYLYHCHETSVLHVQAGMYGMVIVRPQSADTLTWESGYSFHSERAWLASEIDTNWHNDSIIHHPHDTTATTHLILDYEPQHFLINGKSEQQLLNT
ncbi:MAG: multicopper oxidase domain-containing protein, partial [Crocinitomicaceae bacterium]|nr:multicopper oxidase domain-containing protein [Crocinitomicaceae bacterium]